MSLNPSQSARTVPMSTLLIWFMTTSLWKMGRLCSKRWSKTWPKPASTGKQTSSHCPPFSTECLHHRNHLQRCMATSSKGYHTSHLKAIGSSIQAFAPLKQRPLNDLAKNVTNVSDRIKWGLRFPTAKSSELINSSQLSTKRQTKVSPMVAFSPWRRTWPRNWPPKGSLWKAHSLVLEKEMVVKRILQRMAKNKDLWKVILIKSTTMSKLKNSTPYTSNVSWTYLKKRTSHFLWLSISKKETSDLSLRRKAMSCS